MASVTGKQSSKIDDLFGPVVVGGSINGAGMLLLNTRAGAVLNLGQVVFPATNYFLAAHPIGAIYFSVAPANPGVANGGTWVAWGSGRVPVGVSASDTEFDTVEETGGEKTHTLITSETPSHTHAIDHDHPVANTSTDSHSHTTAIRYSANGVITGTTPTVRDVGALSGGGGSAGNAATSSDTHSHTLDVPAFAGASGSAGSGGAHNNLQPYITVYMWKRTA